MTTPSLQYAVPRGEPLTGYQQALLALQGTIAVCLITLATVAWLGVQRLEARDAARQQDLRQFHAELVENIAKVAERAGMLTSADLCPIRFRARLPNGVSPPARALTAQLTPLEPARDVLLMDTTSAGIVDFGLNPPGRYRLDLKTEDGYALRHEFDVVPGVPIDRLVLCPNRNPEVGSMIAFPIPERVTSAGLVATFCFEQDDLTIGEWTWRPLERGRRWVVSGETDTLDLLAAELASTGRLDGDVAGELAFRYCRLLAVSFWRLGAGREPPREVKRFEFSEIAGAASSGCDVVLLRSDPPRYERDPNSRLQLWAVPPPTELETALQVWSAEMASVSGSQWSGADTARRAPYGKVRYVP
jgi:hypothetical protein